jgi:prophage tail gpP-like protein
VNGYAYGGWESVAVTRTIEAISGEFTVGVHDRWAGQREPWEILEEDICSVEMAGQRVILGYVDKRALSFQAITISGRDRSAALVDNSAFPGQWERMNVSLERVAQELAEPFGISVSVQPGLKLPLIAKLSIDPGDSPFDAIERGCRIAGVLAVSDGSGGVLLTRPGSARAVTELVEGQNILDGSADYDASERFSRYVVLGQHQGSNELDTASTATVFGEARDAGVRRLDRIRVARAESAVSGATARRRAEWEAKVRAARGDSFSITVQGWLQGDGTPWPVNALVPVRSRRLDMDGTFLISQARYSKSSSGTTTVLTLRRPDAFIPEPVVQKFDGRWKELRKFRGYGNAPGTG